jgi:serine/threonine protein phosphatase PrpC
MPLVVSLAYSTRAGVREQNEDYLAVVSPTGPELSTKGLLAAIADGVSGNDGGREASEYTVRGLLSDYYATPDTWSITQSLDKVISTLNSWIQKQGSIKRELAGMATTLTALVLRGNFYYFAHVGDTRLYLWRNQTLTCLTTDHVWDRPEMRHVLTRAIGLDHQVVVDHGMGQLQINDVFLLLCDGVWSSVSRYDLEYALKDFSNNINDAQTTADSLIDSALANHSKDNVSAMLIRVDALPENDLRDSISASHFLPLPPLLKKGQKIDGLKIDSILNISRVTAVYRVIEIKTGRKLVLKTLHPDRESDLDELKAFAHEEWIAKRVVARFFPQVVVREERSFFYFLTTWHEGDTLARHIDVGEHFLVPDIISNGIKLIRAVAALHRRSILHRDIKPQNIHIGSDAELRLFDFGVAQSGMEESESIKSIKAGTPSYLAPEQFDGAAASVQTDLYAIGVTLYYLLTRHYPYGEVEAFQKPRFNAPIPPTRYRPETPVWLENILLKAVAKNPRDRFETAEEFLIAMERGASHTSINAPVIPMIERDSLTIWRIIAISSIVINLLFLYVFLAAHLK